MCLTETRHIQLMWQSINDSRRAFGNYTCMGNPLTHRASVTDIVLLQVVAGATGSHRRHIRRFQKEIVPCHHDSSRKCESRLSNGWYIWNIQETCIRSQPSHTTSSPPSSLHACAKWPCSNTLVIMVFIKRQLSSPWVTCTLYYATCFSDKCQHSMDMTSKDKSALSNWHEVILKCKYICLNLNAEIPVNPALTRIIQQNSIFWCC